MARADAGGRAPLNAYTHTPNLAVLCPIFLTLIATKSCVPLAVPRGSNSYEVSGKALRLFRVLGSSVSIPRDSNRPATRRWGGIWHRVAPDRPTRGSECKSGRRKGRLIMMTSSQPSARTAGLALIDSSPFGKPSEREPACEEGDRTYRI